MLVMDVLEHIQFAGDNVYYRVAPNKYINDREEFLFEYGEMPYRGMTIDYDYDKDVITVDIWRS